MFETIAHLLDIHDTDENPHQRLDAIRYRIKAGDVGVFSDDWAIFSTERGMSLDESRAHLAVLAKAFSVEIRDMGTWFAGRFTDGASEGKWIWSGVCEGQRLHLDYSYETDDFEALQRLNPTLQEAEIMRLLGWD